MRFSIGEKVSFLNEKGGGIVLSYKTPYIVVVEDETGFDREFPESELVKILGNQDEVITNSDFFDDSTMIPSNVGQSTPRSVTKHEGFWEIDLHSHELMDSEKGLSNHQILSKQLYEFKRCFKQVKTKKIRKFVIIHGVGEGVLKTEVRNYLKGQENIDYYDADFRNYGKGATEVRLYYKS